MRLVNMLLASSLTDDTIAIIILSVAVIVAILIVVGLKNYYKKDRSFVSKNQPKHLSLSLNKQYLTPKEWTFLSALYKALPQEFVAFPRVKLSNIINSSNDRTAKDLINDHQVDVCVFLQETLEPILVIDLTEDVATNLTFKTTATIIKQSLKVVKLPLLEIPVKDSYDLVELRRKLINAMPDKVVAVLKSSLLK